MVIIQIDRINEDVYECSALVEIIKRHFADIVEKSVNLRFGQTDFFVALDSELRFQFSFLSLAAVQSLGQHIYRLPLLDAFPKVLNLLSEGTLNQRLFEIDVEAKTMVESIITLLAAERGIDENMKARDMLRWVAEMNNVKASAEEIVLREVVYV